MKWKTDSTVCFCQTGYDVTADDMDLKQHFLATAGSSWEFDRYLWELGHCDTLADI